MEKERKDKIVNIVTGSIISMFVLIILLFTDGGIVGWVISLTDDLQCEVTDHCGSGTFCVFSMYNNTNSHIATCASDYPLKVCCGATGTILTTSTSNNKCTSNQGFLFSGFKLYNTHVDTNDKANFGYDNNFCLSSSNTKVSCSVESGACATGTCVAKLFDYVNSHVGDCSSEYGLTLCCGLSDNQAPSISTIPDQTIGEDQDLVLDLSPYISDPDNFIEELIITEDSNFAEVSGHIITFNSPTYGLEIFQITVSDGELNDVESVAISVSSVNDAPVITNLQSSINVEINEPYSLIVTATDEEGDQILFSDTFDIFDIGILSGDISFMLTNLSCTTGDIIVTDNNGASSSTTLEYCGVLTNTPPVIDELVPLPGDITMLPLKSLEFSVEATDPEAQAIIYSWYLDGTLSDTSDSIELTFLDNETGDHTLSLTISDGEYSASVNWEITVSNETSGPPILVSNIPNRAWEANSSLVDTFDLDDYFIDPENDTLVYSVSGNTNIFLVLDDENLVSLSHVSDFIGEESVVIFASDGINEVTSNNVTFTVYEPTIEDDGTICGNNLIEGDEECDGTDDGLCGGKGCDYGCKCSTETEEEDIILDCSTDWQCSSWKDCTFDKVQIRTCSDVNNCNKDEGKPEESQECTYKETCFDGIKNQDEISKDCGGICEACSIVQASPSTPLNEVNWSLFLIPFLLVGMIIGGVSLHARHSGNKLNKGKDKVHQQIYRAAGLNDEQIKERQLKYYILANMNKGFTKAQLEQKLIQEGWNQVVVDRVYSNIQFHQKIEEKKPIVQRIVVKPEQKAKVSSKDVKGRFIETRDVFGDLKKIEEKV